ncbi:MAG TPA: hypothetical protein VFZ65_10170 [Planctomycetota bacterium]|nr:hypothetical protein [Planctomycetota bacterium]
MSHPCLDVRVWLPLALAAAWFALRERGASPAVPLPQARSVELPALHGLPAPTGPQHFELDAAKSGVRFLVEGPRGQLLVECPAASGHLDLTPRPGEPIAGELELRLDLASLRPAGDGDASIDVFHVLGVHRNTEIVYRARLAATTTGDLPGVEQRTWLGTLQFGARTLRQTMVLWQCALAGHDLRLLGHGTVEAAPFGLPSRRWLLVFEEHHLVTLGLDLAWRRARGR